MDIINLLNHSSQVLARAMLRNVIGADEYFKVYQPINPEDYTPPGSLSVSIPSVAHKGHELGVRDRGDTYEIFYDYERRPGPVELQMSYTAESIADAAEEAAKFLKSIIDEEVLIIVSAPFFYNMRHNSFISKQELVQRNDRERFHVFSWCGTFDQ